LTKVIFDVKPYPNIARTNWDFTTLILKKALDEYVKNNQKLLEIGTGDIAILSIYISKRKSVEITAVDVIPQFVENATKNAMKNGANINLIVSDLFSNVKEKYDIVFWNSVYIPTKWGKKHKITEREATSVEPIFDRMWNGGESGYDEIIRFLKEIGKILRPDAKVLLGINTFYISHSKMEEIIKENNIKLISVVSSRFIPSEVFVLKMPKNNDKKQSTFAESTPK